MSMQVADYDYHLPDELIAQFPPHTRTASRLLAMNEHGDIEDKQFRQIIEYLKSGDLLVLNDTKVVPARLLGRKETGGKIEILLERVIGEQRILAQIKASKAPKVGQFLVVDGDPEASIEVVSRQGSFFELKLELTQEIFTWFEKVGHMPLPPYIERPDQELDIERYQTVFAENKGAVAAPTAGLHFDERLLDKIRQLGVRVETLTLHVGAGTYQPVRVERIDQHQMHSEFIDVSQCLCDAIIETRKNGGRVCAVGTTVVRSLETAARASDAALIAPFRGDTDIFIYPGFKFAVVDLMQTNFHLPQSTLMMLVSAFAGQANIMRAYQHAIAQRYRFFSYGDAMLLERSTA